MSRLKGYLYKDDGTALQGATVTALEGSDSNDGATIGSSTTTGSDGSWSFTSGLTGKNVDVKIQSGTSIRYLKHQDQVQVEHMWVRSDTAAGTPPLRVENAVNSVSNAVVELVGDNSTRADNDEIYISFKLDNDNAEETEFARITAEANDVSNGSEDGEIRFSVMKAGTLTDIWKVDSSTAGATTLDINADALTIGSASDTDISLTFDANTGDGVITWMEDEDYFQYSDDILMSSTEKILFGDTGTFIHQSADGVLTIESDTTVDINGAVALNGAVTGATNITLSGELDAATLDISGNADIDGIANLDNTDIDGTLVVDGSNISLDSTTTLNIDNSNTSNGITIGTATSGVPVSIGHTTSETTVNDNLTVTGDATITGDLTISGDDLVMGTNTAGMLLVADGTNFNPTAVGSLSEISSIADDDVFLAVDTSGGGLKKVARSQVVSGLATSSGIASVANDSTPELGGDLDVLTHGIVTGASNRNIALTPHGTGVVRIDGSNGIDIESGAISIKNSGSESYVRLYCESSNAHYTQLQAAPHASYSGNVTVVLPATADTLVGKATTDTLTNKTLTSPKINEDVAVTSTATELNLLDGVSGLVQADFTKLAAVDSTAAELNIVDGGTSATSTTVADADRVVLNDNGTMVQVAVTDLAAYFDDEITAMPNLTSVGTLSTLTVDNVITNGTTIGHTDDTDLMTLADGVLSVAGTLDVTGSVETATIDFTDGDNALTIADGGGVTFPQAATFTGGFTANDDINLTKQKVIKIGGTQEAHDFGDEHTGHGITVTMEAGENLTLGAAVYVDSNGKAQHPDVDASSVTGKPAIGIAMTGASSGASVNVLVLGLFHDDSYNFTPGSPIIMTGTDGALTTTASDTAADGDIVQRIGIAITADTAFIMPSIDEIEHA